MSKLGQILRAERESRELLLHEIGMSLKISPKVLQAIEEGDRSNLPAKTFLRGFIKSYAQYLRLDPNHILELFQEEYGTPAAIETPSAGEATPLKEPIQLRVDTPLRKTKVNAIPASNTVKALPIIGALILLMLISFVVKMMDKYQKESEVEQVEAPVTAVAISSAETTALPLSSDTTSATPAIAISSAQSISSTPTTMVTTTSLKPTTTTSSTMTTTTTLKPSTTTSTTTTVKPTTTTTTTSTTTTTTTTLKPTTTTTLKPTTTTKMAAVVPAATSPVEVIIEALNSIEVKFTLDNGTLQTLALAPDQVHTFRGKSAVQLEVSDGGAVNVIVNGRDRGVPGSIGKSIKLSYP
jgi:cytoskeleton protein RodZ